MVKYGVSLVFTLLLVVGTGCVRASQQADSADVQIKLAAIPFPPVIGESRLVIQIADRFGEPIDEAHMDIKGDMTHAGMVPILAEVEGGGENGVYNVPFEWTMAGDWMVTVNIQLPDGTKAQERFEMTILFEDEEFCGEHEQER